MINREWALPWLRAGVGYAGNEFGVGLTMTLFGGSLGVQLLVGPFYVYIEIDGER